MAESMLSICGGKQQVFLLFLIQFIIILLMGMLTTYGPEAHANVIRDHSVPNKKGNISFEDDPLRIYPNEELQALLDEDCCQTQEKLAESLGVTQAAIAHVFLK